MGVTTNPHLRKRGLFAYVISARRLLEGSRAIRPPDRRKLAVATHYEVRWLASAIVSLPEHDRRFAE
jgi:hypothetical protein